MSILSSLKEDRRMSMNHWRYRLLHWAFNVKDVKHPEETGLPMFLYTHFCPLFHITNLIAILSPLILFFKVVSVVFRAACGAFTAADWSKPIWVFEKIGLGVGCCIDWLSDVFGKMFSKQSWDYWVYKQPEKRKRTKEEEHLDLVGMLTDWYGGDADRFWSSNGYKFTALTEEEVKAEFVRIMPQVLLARQHAADRQKRLREMLIFWVNFSHVFIKWTLNIFYVALAVGLFLLIWFSFWSVACFIGWLAADVWWFLCWMWGGLCSINLLDTLKATAYFMLFVLAVIIAAAIPLGLGHLLVSCGWMKKFFSLCGSGLVKLAPPFYLVGTLAKWVKSGFVGVCEFVAMFYEENCPAVVIIDEKEAIIEKENE